VTEGPPLDGLGQPRGKRRLGAAVALAVCALLWLLGLLGTSDPYVTVWFAAGLLTCLAGLAVVIGRICVRRGDAWQAALVAAFASVFGELSPALLLLPPVRRSLRDVPSQWRARRETEPAEHTLERASVQSRKQGKVEPLSETPDEAAGTYRRGAALALGLVATTLAFWSSAPVLVWLGFASSTLTDGDGVALGLFLALVVSMAGFVGVLVVQRSRRALARVEQAAASGMVVAIVCVALDGGDLHWSDGNRVSVGFLYWLWALTAILFVWGAALTRIRGPEENGGASDPSGGVMA
jgi:hypothetical protein